MLPIKMSAALRTIAITLAVVAPLVLLLLLLAYGHLLEMPEESMNRYVPFIRQSTLACKLFCEDLCFGPNSTAKAQTLREYAHGLLPFDKSEAIGILKEAFEIQSRRRQENQQSFAWLEFEDALALADTACELAELYNEEGDASNSEKWFRSAVAIIDNRHDYLYNILPVDKIADQYKQVLKRLGKQNEIAALDQTLRKWKLDLEARYNNAVRKALDSPLRTDCALNFRKGYLDSAADALVFAGNERPIQQSLDLREQGLMCAAQMKRLRNRPLELIQSIQLWMGRGQVYSDQGELAQANEMYRHALEKCEECLRYLKNYGHTDPVVLFTIYRDQAELLECLGRHEDSVKADRKAEAEARFLARMNN